MWTAISVMTLFIYYEIYRWVPLGRWNWQFRWPVNNDQFYPDMVIGFLLIWVAWSFARKNGVSMWMGTCLLALWTTLHLVDWWIPYVKNTPENLGRYDFYSQRTQILPVFGNQYPPDAGHAILDFLLFPTFAIALVTAIANLRSGRPSTNAI